jgi:hypothetical protein
MDTAWIQVFVLTLSECLAPAGKSVCQEQELQMQFMKQTDCEIARDQFVALIELTDNSIVNKDKTRCTASAIQQQVFESLGEVKPASATDDDWAAPVQDEARPQDFAQVAHQERLAALPNCDEVSGTAPCKIGEIIVEGATEQRGDVWQRQ